MTRWAIRKLRFDAALIGLLAATLASVTPLAAQQPNEPAAASAASAPLVAAWLTNARIGGAELYAEMTDREFDKELAALVAQNVSVVEADSDLSQYLTEKQFEAELSLMRRFTAAAHALNLKVVWYYPTLEVLSPQAKRGHFSMYRTHPTWVQRGMDGKPNVFYGGTGRIHWVEPGTESAWMSVHSPYVDMYLGRIRRIAATGVDGLWLDVPLYNDIATAWADVGAAAKAKFKSDTGMDAPKAVNWSDPVWRRWIAWRYGEISNFILRIREASKAVDPQISVIVETVTMDYDATTMLALDGSTFKSASDIIQVWEVDVLSDRSGMRNAHPDDWISLIGMSKFGKAASGTKPSWMFTYGQEPDDGLLVMAEALAAGNNPYETKVPKMTTTIGAAYRQRMFSWIKENEHRLFGSDSAAKVAIYYSPASRDYLDHGLGTGLFASIHSKDALWWAKDSINSVYARTYLAEYRGIIKWLVRHHVPFDTIVRPDAQELARYKVVIGPALSAVSDAEVKLLDDYVAEGGHLVTTGPAPGALDEFGNPRGEPALQPAQSGAPMQVSALTPSTPRGGTIDNTLELVGKSYLVSTAPAAEKAIGDLVNHYAHSAIETDAGVSVHIELRKDGNETLLHLIDPERLWDRRVPHSRQISIKLAVPAGRNVTAVQVTSPQAPSPAPAALPFEAEGGQVSFKVPLEAYALVVVTTQPR